VFSQFQEGKINFPPTYKYLPGTQDFETKKMRVPSWCDRILFRAPDEGLNQLFYTSVTKFVFSDHKPVTSLSRQRSGRRTLWPSRKCRRRSWRTSRA